MRQALLGMYGSPHDAMASVSCDADASVSPPDSHHQQANSLPQSPCYSPIPKLLQVIFETVKNPPYSASDAALKATSPLFVLPHSPATPRGLSLSLGSSTTLNQQMGNTSACTSTSNALASLIPQTYMALIPAHFVVTLAMVHGIAPETDLCKVLYIFPMPYKPDAWKHTLSNGNLLSDFPKLVHDITYGSLIGNPPPMTATFLPPNLASANLHPEIIDLELLTEVSAGQMSGPFSTTQATAIFNGFFHSSPVGIVEKNPGDGLWHIIRHLSK